MSLSAAERMKLDDMLLIQLQKAPLPFINSLLSFWPIQEKGEPNAHLFTDWLEFKNPGCSIAYPKSDFFINEMTALLTTEETDFVPNEFSIMEPEEGFTIEANEIDMVLVPLLAFDTKGCRVGFGKGFYDKYMAGTKDDCVKVGFSYFDPVDHISDAAEFDVPLDLCITPQTVYVF